MRKMIFAAVLLAASLSAYGQTRADFAKQYNSQVEVVGFCGLGVESILDKWEAAFPADGEMLRGRFTYFLSMAKNSAVEVMDRDSYMGADPVLQLKDSLGNPVKYFMVTSFDDSLFRVALNYIDMAIEQHPRELSYYAEKFAALSAYEKEVPSRSFNVAVGLVDHYGSNRNSSWTIFSRSASPAVFQAQIQDFCYTYYRIASPESYEAFFRLASAMCKLFPKSEVFLGDIASYWLVARKDTKKAAKYYRKVLKINPANEIAIKNMEVISLIEKDRK